MKFPWQRRADTEQGHRVHAETRLDAARADWTPIRASASAMRRERELNGWTDTIVAIFGTPQQRKGHHP